MKMGVFAALSIPYWVLTILVMALAAIGECGMAPHALAECEGVSPAIMSALSLLIFGGLSFAFFKLRLSGVDRK